MPLQQQIFKTVTIFKINLHTQDYFQKKTRFFFVVVMVCVIFILNPKKEKHRNGDERAISCYIYIYIWLLHICVVFVIHGEQQQTGFLFSGIT